MRWIFFTLLGVNIALLAYSQWERLSPVAGVQPSPLVGNTVPSLVLLEEKELKSLVIESVRLKTQAGVQGLSVEGTARELSVASSVCTLVGAFSERIKAEYFVRRLSSLGVKAEIKNLLVSTTVGFWLHLPPLSSRKELLRRLDELQRQGVDSYVIPDGDLKNGISLGMFSEERRAQSLQKQIVSLGYSPEVAQVPREKRELWVFLFQQSSAKIDQEMWSKLLSGKELLQKQKKLCSDVASA